ncbi:hypothetical protein HMPREF9120_02609 [Neisseria sp. oral taxon 020 str. F0370]|nr:hypothetical protein HMPREF9120_02609 [Neisseria sp. oral taxon 020 str. F0370]
MEMHPSFAAVGQAAEEGIHQKTFPPADAAVKIQPLGQLRRTQTAAEKAVAFAFEHHQFRPQPVEMFDGACLCGVANKRGLLRSCLIPGQRAVILIRGRNKTGGVFFGHGFQTASYFWQRAL